MSKHYCEVKRETLCILKEYNEWIRDDCKYCILLQLNNNVHKIIEISEKSFMPGIIGEELGKAKKDYIELYSKLIDELGMENEIEKFIKKMKKSFKKKEMEAKGYV